MRLRAAWLVACLAWGAPLVAVAEEPPEAQEIARRADDVLRGDTTVLSARMTIATPKGGAPRVVAFHSWNDKRAGRSFLRLLAPAAEAGTAFLYLPPNLWNRLPREERTLRIPEAAWSEPWLGSAFDHDDLMHASSLVEDYTHRLLREEEDADGRAGVRAFVVEYRPREATPVAWGRIEAWVETGTYTPLRQDFFDAQGARLRTLRFEDVRRVGERAFPHRWVMTSLAEPGGETRIEIQEIRFDSGIDAAVFSTRNLKQP